MINACIHRRKAKAEADFAESGVSKLGPTPLAGSVMQSAIVSQDSAGAQAWEDATGDGWGDAEDDVWNDAHAKDAKGGNEWADPDDDIDLTSMIGGAIADKTTKTGAEGNENRRNRATNPFARDSPVTTHWTRRDRRSTGARPTARRTADGDGTTATWTATPTRHPRGSRGDARRTSMLRPPHPPHGGTDAQPCRCTPRT